jgi:hypothetical protein
MTGRPDLESRSQGQYDPPVPLFVTMCTAARTFPPRTMLWYFLAIEVASSIPARGPPPPPPTSRVASSTSLTRATQRSASHASSRPQMIGLTWWKREIPRTRRRMHAWKTSGRSEFQRRSTTPTQRFVSVSRNRVAQQPLGRLYSGRLQAATLRWSRCHLASSATPIPPSRWVPWF